MKNVPPVESAIDDSRTAVPGASARWSRFVIDEIAYELIDCTTGTRFDLSTMEPVDYLPTSAAHSAARRARK